MKQVIRSLMLLTTVVLVRFAASGSVPSTLGNYGLLADSELRLRDATVRAGAVGVNRGDLLVTHQLDTKGTVAADSVHLSARTRCGALIANQVLPTAPGCGPATPFAGPIVSSLAEACSVPVPAPPCDSAAESIIVGHGEKRSLAPGHYGALVITGGGRGAGSLELSGGDYLFCDVRLARDAAVTATAPSTVMVLGRFATGNGGQVGGPAPVRVLVAGRSARLSRRTKFTGDLCAPSALLSIADNVTVEGCLAADRIIAQDNLVIRCEPGATTTTTTARATSTTSSTSSTSSTTAPPSTTTVPPSSTTTASTSTTIASTTTTSGPTTTVSSSSTTTTSAPGSTSTTQPTTTTTTGATSSTTTTPSTSTTTVTASSTTTTTPTTTTVTATTSTSTTLTSTTVTTSSTTTTTSSTTTTTGGIPVCGNGVREGTEECDDGNEESTDACTNQCKTARCGDGIVRFGVEACDDGNASTTDCCDNSCNYTPPVCGNGCLTPGESCDDGNMANGDACPSTCVINSCTPSGTTQVVTLSLKRTSPPALGTLTAFTLLLDYPDGVVSIPGSGSDGSVLSAVLFQLSASGRTLTRVDLDYGIRLGVLGVSNMLTTTNPTAVFKLTFDLCAGAPAPTAGQFPCTISSAVGSNDYSAAQLAGLECTITIP